MSSFDTLKDVDAGTYDTTTLYRDPRKSPPMDGLPERIYVFSFPTREAAKEWAEKLGIPKKYWEEDKQRVRVHEPYIVHALQLPVAPKDLIEKIVQQSA